MRRTIVPLRKSNSILKAVNGAVWELPCAPNLNMWWNFGSCLGILLATQIVSGMLLAIHYTAYESISFESVKFIMRDVNYGWLIRGIHSNGASVFFVCLYLHIGRGLYYASYSSLLAVWNVGVVLYLMSMAIAFLGYVLPWGTMSFWGATVITNLFTVVPYIGNTLVYWMWGGYSVSGPTLKRFFVLHFFLPLAMVVVVMLHLLYLHEGGSNNPLGVSSDVLAVRFHPFYTSKDLVGLAIVYGAFGFLALGFPDLLSNYLNNVPVDALRTPRHIEPEWYFLYAYAILRSVPHKTVGIIAMLMSILVMALLPYVDSSKCRGLEYYPLSQFLFWAFVSNWALLGWIGSMPPKGICYDYGQWFTVFHLVCFGLLVIFNMVWDKWLFMEEGEL
uniref:cytochrome b n=1 Tax=Pinna rudis TaxID=1380992 RepID=UPI001EDD68CC|nr:cytochrome b [Pinna rudis]BCX41853.1 cytochrome b [Pinna rudis]